MCFLALLYKVVPEYPVVVAANRDERLDRPGTGPKELRPDVWGGRDPQAGGTWLGVNAGGLLVGIANVASADGDNLRAKSRGLLCLDLLSAASADQARADLQAKLKSDTYNGFNLLLADDSRAWVATYANRQLQIRALKRGIHIIGNTAADSTEEPKVARGISLIRPAANIEETLQSLAVVCADHGVRADGADAICVHGSEHGTLCSSLIAIHDNRAQGNYYRHAQGQPCRTPYTDVSCLIRVPHP